MSTSSNQQAKHIYNALTKTARSVSEHDKLTFARNLYKLSIRLNPVDPLKAIKQVCEHAKYPEAFNKRKKFFRGEHEGDAPDLNSSPANFMRLAKSAATLWVNTNNPDVVTNAVHHAAVELASGTSFNPESVPLNIEDRSPESLLRHYFRSLATQTVEASQITAVWNWLPKTSIDIKFFDKELWDLYQDLDHPDLNNYPTIVPDALYTSLQASCPYIEGHIYKAIFTLRADQIGQHDQFSSIAEPHLHLGVCGYEADVQYIPIPDILQNSFIFEDHKINSDSDAARWLSNLESNIDDSYIDTKTAKIQLLRDVYLALRDRHESKTASPIVGISYSENIFIFASDIDGNNTINHRHNDCFESYSKELCYISQSNISNIVRFTVESSNKSFFIIYDGKLDTQGICNPRPVGILFDDWFDRHVEKYVRVYDEDWDPDGLWAQMQAPKRFVKKARGIASPRWEHDRDQYDLLIDKSIKMYPTEHNLNIASSDNSFMKNDKNGIFINGTIADYLISNECLVDKKLRLSSKLKNLAVMNAKAINEFYNSHYNAVIASINDM